MLNLLRSCQLSKVHSTFCFPPVIYEGCSYFISLPTSATICIFHYGHSSGYEVVIHFGINLIFQMTNGTEYFSMCLLATYISFLVKCLCRIFAYFKVDFIFKATANI